MSPELVAARDKALELLAQAMKERAKLVTANDHEENEMQKLIAATALLLSNGRKKTPDLDLAASIAERMKILTDPAKHPSKKRAEAIVALSCFAKALGIEGKMMEVYSALCKVDLERGAAK